jgi:hypothetical protein
MSGCTEIPPVIHLGVLEQAQLEEKLHDLRYDEIAKQHRTARGGLSMFQFINDILEQFLPCFNREASWVNFCSIIIGFIIRPDMRGVSPVISALRMKPGHYTTLLKFFRSNAFDIDTLYRKLIAVCMKILPPKTVDGRVILVGDHIKTAKEGCGMPAIEKLHQESQNSGKGAFIEGHLFGFISMILPGFNRSIPVMAGIQESKTKAGGESLIVRMVKEAGKVVEMMGKPAILLLDAYFFSKTTLITASQYIGKNGQALLSVIIRAKQFAVAYREPERGSGKKRGRPRVYGKKALLETLFRKNRKDFIKTNLVLYGKKTEVHYLCADLIQRPTRQRVRFVLTIIGNSHFMLMSTSRALDGETIITLYARRFKIEGLFGELKNRLGGFAYHFWTYSLEKRKKGKLPVLPKDKRMLDDVQMTKKSIETFVFCQCLSCAILTGLGLTESKGIWGRFTGWLRIVRTSYPSIRVTKQVVSEDFHRFLPELKRLRVFGNIIESMRPDAFLYKTA